MTARALILAGTGTGTGKTMLTAALIRAFVRAGDRIAAFKTGPDYIDPAHLAQAAGAKTINLDSWAMEPDTLRGLLAALARESDLVVGEGVMGLFDGARGPSRDGFAPGSTAELAHLLGLPVVLVVDGSGMGQSLAATARGFATHDLRVRVSGLIVNRVASESHGRFLAEAIDEALPDVPVLGLVPRLVALDIPSRHLGLIQAAEIHDLDRRFDSAAAAIASHVDMDTLAALARPVLPPPVSQGNAVPRLPRPIGQRIAVARDEAFAFAYTSTLDAWRTAGAEITTFSPLADEPPDSHADAVYLPGGYPELHAARLASGERFRAGLVAAASRDAFIFGECGGYMTLGRTLRDAEGRVHRMAELLPVSCDFSQRKLHLGYRNVRTLVTTPLAVAGTVFAGHEFHYARVVDENGTPMFAAIDAAGCDLGTMGLIHGRVAGSFVHIIAQR